jgi:hypothetical protein
MSEIKTKNYVYVMISTLNQMVNYIPLKHFKFKDIYNLTIAKSDYVDNSRWDENLSKILKKDDIEFNYDDEIKNLKFQQDDINDIDKILDVLEANFNDNNNDKIFWNITGGQRPFILAIYQFIQKNNRSNDYICYLEGNKSKMVILQDNEVINNDSYNLEDLQISTALELMGFKINKKIEKNYDEDKKEFYLEFLDKYTKSKELREKLISLNKKDTDKDKTIKDIKKILPNLDKTTLDEIFSYSEKDDKQQKKIFGYILESLAGYKILEVAKDKIADINFSEKINHLRKEDRTSKKEIDEFDIALLTKNGKFMIFECKSGGMDGDVAKSTKYSTYAVSGAYGLPILITPLLKNEIIAIRKKSTISGNFKENSKYLKNDTYKNIRQAINSAIRAGLEVWGLDEIEKKLEKYIEL